MDPSAPVAQDVQNQTKSDQSVPAVSDNQQQSTTTQPNQPAVQQPLKKPQISISGGGIEEGASMIVADNPDADEDDEDELQVAPQEKKNLGVMGQGDAEEQDELQGASQQGVVDIQDESAELEPAIPEVVTSSPEVEKLIEITPPDKPELSDEVKKIGVTHSGPGIIDPGQLRLPDPKIPISIQQVLSEEEKIKSNRLHTSKFWLLQKIKYLWRKINPEITSDLKKQQTKPVIPAKTQPVKKDPVTINTLPETKSITTE
jgi:hypothetical protein